MPDTSELSIKTLLRHAGAGLASILAVALTLPLPLEGGQAGSSSDARTAALDAELPWSPALRTGRLANGLTYYVRENDEPQNRAELRLVVKAGSVLEDGDQLGLAHFAEHMAFNGTENFAEQELVEFMESIGMGFGADLNAYTGFDETVYMLRIPTDDEEIVGTAFQILDDWAHGVAFAPEEIEKERGVVIEEWRQGRGATSRVRDQQFPILFQDSRYAERLPIGEMEVLENFEREALVRFYEDWYRPGLMAVVAVGDFEVAAMEARIREQFADLQDPADRRTRPTYDVPRHEDTLYAITTDPEITRTSVAVYQKLEPPVRETVGDYRRTLVERLYNGLLNDRLREISQRPDPPFIGASSSYGRFVRGQGVYVLAAGVPDGGVEEGLEALFTEARRVETHGFTEAELGRQKRAALRRIEQAWTDRANRDSAAYAAEYIRNFLQDEPVPGIEYEYGLYQRFVPEIGLAEVNDVGREWIASDNRVVLVTAPENADVPVPERSDLVAVFEAVETKDIEPWTDSLAEDATLMESVPDAGVVVDQRGFPELDITEWTLSNGATVVLKPTDFKDDEILMAAFSPGGTSLAPDESFVPAATAAQVVASGGLGEYDAIDLRKLLADKAASVDPAIASYEERLSGRASPKDLATLFELLHLRFTAPRRDEQIFQVLTQQMRAMLANRDKSPAVAFGDKIQEIMSQGHPRVRPLTAERVNEMDLDSSYDFYRQRFADASDFTFVFVGAFEAEALRPLVERYIGSLPGLDREESWRDLEIEPPTGVVEEAVERGLEPRSQTRLVFHGPFQYDMQHRTEIRLMADVLEIQLRNLLREDLGGTYGVGVSPTLEWRPDETYELAVTFGSDPARADELLQQIFAEIAEMKAQGPPPDDVADVQEQARRDFETSREQNGFWLTQIAANWRSGEDPRGLLEYPEIVDGISAATLQEAARRYLDTERYVRVSLFPEGRQQGAGLVDPREIPVPEPPRLSIPARQLLPVVP